MYEASFRENHALPVFTDYFSKETKTYFEAAEQIARLHILFDRMGLKQGDKVALIGFGNFEVRDRAARTGKNLQTGEEIKIAACKVPAFKAGKALKEAVNK